MSNETPLVLVGNALSVMVAATRLARRGNAVTIVNGTGNWGGHFSRMNVGGYWFDPGMVTYEFTSFSRQAAIRDVDTYDPAVRSDVGRFCDVVRAFVDEYQETRSIPTPSMMVGGRLLDDVILANALDSLSALPFADSMERDLASSPPPGLLHASNKRHSDAYLNLDLESASRANHGTTFHERLIEPLCQKLLSIPSRHVLARYHRVAWLPLFYPETLLSYLRGERQAMPPTVFSYPTGGNIGDLTDRLKSEILSSPNVQVIAEKPTRVVVEGGSTRLHLASGASLLADRVAWSFGLGELLRLIGREESAQNYEKCSVALVFARISTAYLARGESIVSIVDPEFTTFRITNQTACAGGSDSHASLVIEINPDSVGGSGPDAQHSLATRVKAELLALGWVRDVSHIEIVGVKVLTKALMLPTRGNRDAHATEDDAVNAAMPNLRKLGPASGFFTSSLNDQIVQGLQLAREQERLS